MQIPFSLDTSKQSAFLFIIFFVSKILYIIKTDPCD